MAKKNLSRLKKQACPCQNDVEDWKTEGLVRVRERYYYEQRHKEKQSRQERRTSTFGASGPKIPETNDGTEITHENFPESNMVCPACEQQYVVMVEFVELEDTDKYKRKESPCDYCEGTGSIAGGHVAVEEEPCPECNGTGHNL